MDNKERAFAPMLALALIIMTSVSLYAYSLHARLEATMESFSALEQDRNGWKSKAEHAEGIIDTASASLNYCSAQIDDLKSQLVMAPKPPDGSRS